MHEMWSAVAPAWEQNADVIDERAEAATARMLELARLGSGERVLELACGPGGLGLAAAAALAADGDVVLSDVAPEMTEIAARRAAARGLDNVTTKVLDLEAIEQPDASYDVVLCREGLMFASDHARALAEIARVLRPGGRLVAAVWGPRERNPWLAIVMDSVGEQLGMPMPPPGVNGPFALSDRDQLASLLAGAGFGRVSVTDFDLPMRADSVDEWWSRASALAGPLAKLLESLDGGTVEAIRARAAEASREYEAGGALELPGVTLLAAAVKP